MFFRGKDNLRAVSVFLFSRSGKCSLCQRNDSAAFVVFTKLSYLGSFKMPSGDFGMTNGRFNYSTPFMFGTVYNDPTHGKTIYATGYLSSGDVLGTASIAQVSIPATLANPYGCRTGRTDKATVVGGGFRNPSSGINNTILQGSTGMLNGIVHNNKCSRAQPCFTMRDATKRIPGGPRPRTSTVPAPPAPIIFLDRNIQD